MTGARYQYLCCLDFDSTLIHEEIIDELGKIAGAGDEIAEITRRAMDGEIDFEEALRERAMMLAGVKVSDCLQLAHRIRVRKGAAELFDFLSERGAYCAVISGSLNPVAAEVARRREFGKVEQFIFNTLVEEGNALSGGVVVRVGNDKGAIVRRLRTELHIGKARTIAIGDGSTDVAMFAQAAFSVALNGKPAARKAATVSVEGDDLFGVRDAIERWAGNGKTARAATE